MIRFVLVLGLGIAAPAWAQVVEDPPPDTPTDAVEAPAEDGAPSGEEAPAEDASPDEDEAPVEVTPTDDEGSTVGAADDDADGDGVPDWYPQFEEEKAPPSHRLWYRNAFFARINPLGLQDLLFLGYRHQLIKKPGTFFKDSYVFVAAAVQATPSFVRAGARLEIMPISVLRFYAQYQYIGYFGTFGNLTSFDSPDADYSDQRINQLDAAYTATGTVLEVGGRFQFKLGPVAARTIVAFARWDMNLQDGDRFFYEQFWDRMFVNGGWAVQSDTDLLAVIGKASFGVRYTYSDTLLGDGSAADLPNHRMGPLFAWKFHERDPGARFNNPTLFFTAQWWIQHNYRTGQQQPAGLPLLAIGMIFDGDLVGEKPERPKKKK